MFPLLSKMKVNLDQRIAPNGPTIEQVQAQGLVMAYEIQSDGIFTLMMPMCILRALNLSIVRDGKLAR